VASSSGDPLRLTLAGGHGLLPSQGTAQAAEVPGALAQGRPTGAGLAALSGFAQAGVPRPAPGAARPDAAR
jgi:hypothetical protein